MGAKRIKNEKRLKKEPRPLLMAANTFTAAGNEANREQENILAPEQNEVNIDQYDFTDTEGNQFNREEQNDVAIEKIKKWKGKGKGKKSKQEPGEERPAKRVKKEKSMKIERYEAQKEHSNILPTDENETDKEPNNILRPEGSEVNNQPEEGSGREGVSESEPEATVINLNRNEYEEQIESAEEREARNSEVNFEATVFTRHSVKEQGVEQPLRVKVKKEKSLAKSLHVAYIKKKR